MAQENVWDAVPPVPKRKPGEKPEPKPKAKPPEPQKKIESPRPLDYLLDIVYREIVKLGTKDPMGAAWEDVVKNVKQRPSDEVEAAIDHLLKEGKIYEPVLGRMKPLPDKKKTTSEPLQPPTPVAPPAHTPKPTETQPKAQEVDPVDLSKEAAKFGGVPNAKPGYTGKIRNELITVLHGNPYVTYAGLLDAAHREGLVKITTTLIQVPTKDNGETAIVSAAVTMSGESGDRTFTGIGDANTKNVKPIVVMHLIRLAETRAKARALRDAINIGVAAVEELAE